MKVNYLLLGFLILFCCSCSQEKTVDIDLAMKNIPANIDTNILVKDNNGAMLRFGQYMPVILRNEGMIYRAKETFILQRFTKTGLDSIERNADIIARQERWQAYLHKDNKTTADHFKEVATLFSFADSVIVIKSTRTMYLRKNGKDICRFHIDLGRNPVGHKRAEGDGRTPEGVYYLDNKWDRDRNNDWDQGKRYYKSFWISYPSEDDKARSFELGVKPGVGVMIHGTPSTRTNAKDWTNGCIALKNKDMDTLFKYVVAGTIIDIRK
jgi:L,D-peptidoglycan transpeptidase YkuD (ErfK/YbiS/YcfS/YnhG family)